jgi:hypothetical protein
VTTLTNAPSDSSGVTTLLSRIASALTITGGKVDVNDKTEFSLSSAGVQAIWDALTSALTTVGSVGKRIADYLDAAISSRNATAPDNAGIAAIQAKTDNLPANPASQTNLDVAVSTRLASASYTAPDNASVTAIKAKTDNLPATPAATGDAMALTSGERTTLAGVIWDRLLTAITTVGSIGKLLKDNIDAAISSATAPTVDEIWDEPLSGHLTAGTAGKALSDAGGGSVTVNATVAISATQAESVASGEVAISTRYSFNQVINSTLQGNLSTADKIWFAVKHRNATQAPDTEAIIFMEQTDGLTVLDKDTYATAAHGTITVTGSAGDWDIELYIEKTACTLLEDYIGSDLLYEVKALLNGETDPTYISGGVCEISGTLIEAVA